MISDKTGQTFGRLTVLSFLGVKKGGGAVFSTSCECGNLRKVLGKHLKAREVTECRVCAKARRTKAIRRYFIAEFPRSQSHGGG